MIREPYVPEHVDSFDDEPSPPPGPVDVDAGDFDVEASMDFDADFESAVDLQSASPSAPSPARTRRSTASRRTMDVVDDDNTYTGQFSLAGASTWGMSTVGMMSPTTERSGHANAGGMTDTQHTVGTVDVDDIADGVGTVDVDDIADDMGVGRMDMEINMEEGVAVARPSLTNKKSSSKSSHRHKSASHRHKSAHRSSRMTYTEYQHGGEYGDERGDDDYEYDEEANRSRGRGLAAVGKSGGGSTRSFFGRKGRSSVGFQDDAETAYSKKERNEERKRRRKKMRKEMSVRPRPKHFNFDLPESKKDEEEGRCLARLWWAFTMLATCLIPNCIIPRKGSGAKLAWREKLAFFDIFLLFNVVFLVAFGVIPLYFCREKTFLDGQKWYDENLSTACYGLNVAMYAILFLVAGLLVLQCICSLALGVRSMIYRFRKRKIDHDDFDEGVMVMVPCYNEGDSELKKTIDSILYTKYPDDNKVMVVVADGIITGKGEELNTPKTLGQLLGFKLRKRDKGYAYESIGSSKDNRASVYHGTCERDGRSLKYIVIVKRGTPAEKDSMKPGNRGKRDSQLIMQGFFNRVHHDRRLCELDIALCDALNDLHLPVTELRYLLAIDADTRISTGSISHMTYFMERNKKVLACCGETKVDNKATSWVTMIQVFEYFASHQLKKAFEGAFGCVTCLPGCFTMYRIFDTRDFRPLISDDKVYQAYRRNDIESLHEKNLYHLGEDRMLTTLLLKHFPDMRLSFVPWAMCWTIVPDKFWVLLSQRRRWINSTFHNMLELLKVRTMCGCCCLNMKMIVILDMVSTMILPASVLYALSFIYIVFWEKEPFSLVTLVLYGVIFGVQFLVFVVRGRLDYIFWFLVYFILGIPVFYFILPLYSFWRMDDLSWGQTRQVAAEPKPAKK